MLSYNFWESRLGADPSVVGKTIVVNGHSLEIIGVAPRGFDGTVLGSRPMVFVPITMRGRCPTLQPVFENRRSYWIYLFGRLKPGVSLEQARTGLNAIYRPIITDVEAPLQQGMSEQTLGRFKTKEIDVEHGAQGQSSVHKEARTPLLMLFSVTGIVLLIACANIANLLLARGAGRATEMGVRLALGASRTQLLTQLLTESVLLALMGGVAGLLVARWTLLGHRQPAAARRADHAALRAAALGASCSARCSPSRPGSCSACSPRCTARGRTWSPRSAPTRARSRAPRGAARFRATLVTVQIALATALLVSAGLFMKSLVNVTRVDLGVEVDHVVTFAISPERSGYDSTRSAILFGRVEEELAALPGVNGVTSAMVPLLAGDNWGTDVQVQGFPKGPDVDNNSRFNEVGAGYFATLGVPVLAGREFTAADHLGTLQGGGGQRGVREEVQPGPGRGRQVHVRRRRFAHHPDRRRGAQRQVQRREGLRAAGVLLPLAAGQPGRLDVLLRAHLAAADPGAGDDSRR